MCVWGGEDRERRGGGADCSGLNGTFQYIHTADGRLAPVNGVAMLLILLTYEHIDLFSYLVVCLFMYLLIY